MDENLRREIILDHYQNPRHKTKNFLNDGYIKVNSNNESCIDNIDIYILVLDNILKDIVFDGEACAISTSSTSIMIENLIGKTVEEATEYINNFEAMVNEENYDEDLLNEGIVYKDIYKQNNRKTCALLPYKGIKRALNQIKSK